MTSSATKMTDHSEQNEMFFRRIELISKSATEPTAWKKQIEKTNMDLEQKKTETLR